MIGVGEQLSEIALRLPTLAAPSFPMPPGGGQRPSASIAITAWLTRTRKETISSWNKTPSDGAETMSNVLPPGTCFYFGDWQLYHSVKTL